MQNQQPNLATFTKLDAQLLQTMSDNDDAIRNELSSRARGVVGLGICNGLQSSTINYSYSIGSGYTQINSNQWLDITFAEPLSNSSIVVNFEANRYYKFMMHFDYVWAANNYVNAVNGHTGRIEVRLRDITHRHDLLYWTNYIDPDYNMGGVASGNYYIRDYNPGGTSNNTNINIWAWADESAKGSVPSSCHAVRAMAAKTSGNAVIKAQFRPMNAYGGVVPPELMNCTNGQPEKNLPTQYKTASQTFNTEAINQFMGYVSVEDCGIAEKPAGAQPGVMNDTSVAPFFESYENHPYDSANPERP